MKLIKLEIGAGTRPTAGYEHLDIVPGEHIEIVADARKVPLPDMSCSEVYAHWVLEHFAEKELVNVLTEWKRVLIERGKIRIVTSNQKSINECLTSQQINWARWVWLTYGSKADHKVGFSPDSIPSYFEKAGFKDIKVESTWGCENDGCPGIIVEAIK